MTTSTMLFAGSTARRKTSEQCALSFPNCDCPPFTETSHGSRSRLYRRQNLQVNTRWKALDEIYRIYMLLHRSDLNISANFPREFLRFFIIFKQHRQNCSTFVPIRAETSPNLSEVHRFFRNFFHKPHTENLKKILGFFNFAY